MEGTILTVAREGIDHTVRQTRNIHDVESLLETYVSYMEVTLQETPDMLPEPAVTPSPRDDTLTLAVMALPLKLRECVLLYYFQDMNTGEIADTLGISQQAVSTRLMRARGRLRKTLEQEEYERG